MSPATSKDDRNVVFTPRSPWHRFLSLCVRYITPSNGAQQASPASPTTVPWDSTSLRHALVSDFARLLTPPVGPVPWTPSIPEADLLAARHRLREAWSIDPDALVIAALGNASLATDCDAFRSVYTLSLARTGGLQFTTVLPRAARQLRRAARFHQLTSPDARLFVVDDLHASLPACDLALWAGPGFGPMHTPPIAPAIAANSIIHCWRHGVPVIAPHWALGHWIQLSALVDNALTASLTQDATLPELVCTLLTAADPNTRPSLRAKARDFCDSHAAPYAAWYQQALTGQGPGPYIQTGPPPLRNGPPPLL